MDTLELLVALEDKAFQAKKFEEANDWRDLIEDLGRFFFGNFNEY